MIRQVKGDGDKSQSPSQSQSQSQSQSPVSPDGKTGSTSPKKRRGTSLTTSFLPLSLMRKDSKSSLASSAAGKRGDQISNTDSKFKRFFAASPKPVAKE
jgi:hypothetical protein